MSNKNSKTLPVQRERIDYIDMLRLVATFFIVMIHTVYQSIEQIPVQSFEFGVMNVYDSISRWAVPVFVMISGVLFLSNSKPFKAICKKNVLRLVTAFFFWSFLYAAISYNRYKNFDASVEQFFKGHYHMWFVLMIIGLYLVVPLLRKIVESNEASIIFIVLFMVLALAVPTLRLVIALSPDAYNSLFNKIFTYYIDRMNLYMPLGYAGFFVLGYVLHKNEIKKPLEYTIYALGIIGLIVTIVGTAEISKQKNVLYTGLYEYLLLNVGATAIAVFVFFKQHYRVNNPDSKFNKAVRAMSKYSFGVYLVHLMVLEFLNFRFRITPMSFNPVLSCLVLCASVTAVSLLISAVMNHIPFVKKYLI